MWSHFCRGLCFNLWASSGLEKQREWINVRIIKTGWMCWSVGYVNSCWFSLVFCSFFLKEGKNRCSAAHLFLWIGRLHVSVWNLDNQALLLFSISRKQRIISLLQLQLQLFLWPSSSSVIIKTQCLAIACQPSFNSVFLCYLFILLIYINGYHMALCMTINFT